MNETPPGIEKVLASAATEQYGSTQTKKKKKKKKNQNLGETTKEGFLRGLCGYCACLVAMRGSTLLRDVRAEEKRPLFVAESAAAPRWSGVF